MADKGRPSKYKPEYAKQAYKLCQLGATDKQLGQFFGVSEVTINAWKKKYPEFLKSLKESKDLVDSKVERSLFERATGYEFREDKVIGTGENERKETFIKRYPPDSVACIFWLKNRQPTKWKDKQHVEHEGKIEGQIVVIKPDDNKTDN